LATVSQPSIEFFPIGPNAWPNVGQSIVRLEREHFAPGLQDEPRALAKLIKSTTSIVIGVRTAEIPLAGYIASDVLERFGDVPGVRHDPHWGHGDTHYIAAVVVIPDVRHKGVATALTKHCVRAAYDQGFHRVTAHIEAGAAFKIDNRIRVLGSYPDWYGTGRIFQYVEFPSRR